jgi:hypothetical protein
MTRAREGASVVTTLLACISEQEAHSLSDRDPRVVAGLPNSEIVLSRTSVMRRLGKLAATSSAWHCLVLNT